MKITKQVILVNADGERIARFPVRTMAKEVCWKGKTYDRYVGGSTFYERTQ